MNTKIGSSFLLIAAIVAFAAIAPAVLMTAPAVAAQLSYELHLRPEQIGYLFSTELGALSLATVPAYWWLKKIDWRLAAFIAGVALCLGNLGSMFVHTYSDLLMARAFSSFAGGSLMIICVSSAALTQNPSRIYGVWVMGQLVLGAIGLAVLPKVYANFGLAGGYAGLALIGLLILPLCKAFPPQRPITPQENLARNASSKGRIALAISGLLGFYISLSAVWTFIGSVAAEAELDGQSVTSILSVATVMGIVGAALAAMIGERVRREVLLCTGFGMMFVAIVVLLDLPNLTRFAVAAMLFKFTWTYVLPSILACLADLDESGQTMNTCNLVIGAGLAIGPAIAGRLIEQTGSFVPVLTGAAVITALSVLPILISRHKREPKISTNPL